MKARTVQLAFVCMLCLCVSAGAEPDIFLAVPADAYGFAASKNLQASYDKAMAFLEGMGFPAQLDNRLLALKELPATQWHNKLFN